MITYRANDRWTLHAAYCGSVRIGYVEDRERFTAHGWRWQLILLRPEGGAYWGFVSDEGEAKVALEQAFTHWLAEAGLQPKEKTNDPTRDESSIRVEYGNIDGRERQTTKQKRRSTKDNKRSVAGGRTAAKRVR